MTAHIQRIMSAEEADALNQKARAQGFYHFDRRIFTPGMAWFCPWVYDPTGEWAASGKYVMIKPEQRGQVGYLSQHYWNDWADKRPPICVVCPNGEQWEIDRKSSNGDGWKVTGDYLSETPSISCYPSIVVTGYHGWLGCQGAAPGVFTGDIEGRGPTGMAR